MSHHAVAFQVRVPSRHCNVQGIMHASRPHEFFEDAFLAWLDDASRDGRPDPHHRPETAPAGRQVRPAGTGAPHRQHRRAAPPPASPPPCPPQGTAAPPPTPRCELPPRPPPPPVRRLLTPA